MIISHKYRFIFIKCRKTASSSIESYLAQFCGKNDIITPIAKESTQLDYSFAQNYRGLWIPTMTELSDSIKLCFNTSISKWHIAKVFKDVITKNKFFPHIPAFRVKQRVPKYVWNSYYKFCFERNPWDRVISLYYWKKKELPDITIHDIISNNFYRNYLLYADANQKKIIVDYVGKYERLNEELEYIFNRIGIPFNGELKENRLSQTREDRRQYRNFFTGAYEKYIDLIREAYQEEIDLFDYKF